MASFDIGVLGCGWAGAVSSYLLSLKYPGSSIVCIDKDDSLGGLLKSAVVDGFLFDVGGSHVIFSSNPSTLSEILSFLDGNVSLHERKSYILLNGESIPYPFENSLYALPPTTRGEILVSFVESLLSRCNEPGWEPRNLRDWMYGYFGRELSKLYLEPYNRKLWKRPLEEMDVDWVHIPGRLPIPDWREVIFSGAGVRTEGYREQARFYYPLHGGIQSLFNSVLGKALRNGVKVVREVKVTRVRKLTGSWLVNDSIEVKKLVSTIPLNELIMAMDLRDDVLLRLSKQLDYNSVAVVGVGLRRRAPPTHWVYNTRDDVIFHRHAWISNYSSYNTPNNEEYSSLIAEATFPPTKKLPHDKLVDEVISGLTKIGVLENPDKEVMFVKLWTHEYGYPIHTIKSNTARDELVRTLNGEGVTLIGRWGCWRYLNIDRVYEQAVKAVNNL